MATKRPSRKHQWLADRNLAECWLVLRIDNYKEASADRGQFYPATDNPGDRMKALWPDETHAVHAAKWATEKFGHTYGVFKMNQIVEQLIVTPPTKVTRL